MTFFGYKRYETLAKHVEPFFKKHKSERTSVPELLRCNDKVQKLASRNVAFCILCFKPDFNENKDSKIRQYNKIIGIMKTS